MRRDWFIKALEMEREKLGSQESLALKLGKSQSTLSRWLSGKSSPTFDDLCEVAEIFDWDLGRAVEKTPRSGSRPNAALLDAGQESAQVIGPSSSPLTGLRVHLEFQAGRWRKCNFNWARQALLLTSLSFPDDPLVCLWMARAYSNAKALLHEDIEKRDRYLAKTDLKKVLALGESGVFEAEYLLANCYMSIHPVGFEHDPDRSQYWFERILKRDATNTFAHVNYAWLLWKVAPEKDPEAASALLERAVEQNDASGKYLLSILIHEEDPGRSIQLLKEAASRRLPLALQDLGASYVALGQYRQALRCYRLSALQGNSKAAGALEELKKAQGTALVART